MKLRCKHKKTGLFRFLSGIQLSLIIDEGLRRTGYNFEYTNGFNPRIKINFSLPVPVGVASVSEWFDVSLKENVDKNIFMETFNSKIQRELQIIDVINLKDNQKPVINAIQSYEYKIFFNSKIDLNDIEDYEPKKGKILDYSISVNNDLTTLYLKATSTQENYFNVGHFINNMNLRPIIVIKTKTHMG